MPALVDSRGDDDCYGRGSTWCGDSGFLFSFGAHMKHYFPPSKRPRIYAPFIDPSEDKKPSIDALPDECLFEIFRRLGRGPERSTAACVSKRWLMLLSSIHTSEFCPAGFPPTQSSKTATDKSLNGFGSFQTQSNDDLEVEGDGYLSRCLEGRKATDAKLAAVAIGTSTRGGLGKLSIRGNACTPLPGVTNRGLSAVARCCPSLRVLSLWNLHCIDDEGLYEIAKDSHSLEKLDLCQCSSISDKGIVALAESSPNLTSLTLESCSNIGDQGLQAIAKYCRNLQSLTIRDCPLVGDRGVASLFSSGSTVLTKMKLQALNITDRSIAVIGHYGKSITNLALVGLPNVSQKGFWVMGNAPGLQVLSNLTITSCRGITDLSLEAVGKGCPNLKHVCLRKCYFVSDHGLAAFAKAADFLDSLQLEECNRITQTGILNALSSSNSKLKSVSLAKCFGINDLPTDFLEHPPCESLRSLSIRNCPGLGSTSLALIGKLCPQLRSLDLSGLCGISDAGLLPLLERCEAGLVKVNLSNCFNLSDQTVSTLAQTHGRTLEVLNLDGCRRITDASLVALAGRCPLLIDLDVSRCSISDCGVSALTSGVRPNLQVLALSGCSMVSNGSVPALEELGRWLVGLNLQHCNSISGGAIELLGEKLWRCDILA